jgi:hypothetical protein
MQRLLGNPEKLNQPTDRELLRPSNRIEHPMMNTGKFMTRKKDVRLDNQSPESEVHEQQRTVFRLQLSHASFSNGRQVKNWIVFFHSIDTAFANLSSLSLIQEVNRLPQPLQTAVTLNRPGFHGGRLVFCGSQLASHFADRSASGSSFPGAMRQVLRHGIGGAHSVVPRWASQH